MRYFVLLFLFSLGCNQVNKKSSDIIYESPEDNYGSQLFENGFLNFADTINYDSLKSGLIESFDIYNEGTNKIAHIDAEELAEFNFSFFMPSLNKIMDKREFKLKVQKADQNEKSNEVIINNKRIWLYTNEDLEHEGFQELAAKNFFREINRQLPINKVGESFYLLYAGNDLHVLLLTANQQKIIAAKYKNYSKEIPYLP